VVVGPGQPSCGVRFPLGRHTKAELCRGDT
jgi:hypothetical protein